MAAFKAIRLLSDILEHRENNIPGILVSIDSGKDFDFLERSRIHSTLQLFNFGESIRHWVRVFLH